MQREDADDQDDTLDLTEDQIIEDEDDKSGADDDQATDDDPQSDDGDDSDEEETVISFDGEGDDEDQAGDTSVIRRLRQQLREKDKRVRELETSTAKPKVEVGEKPTLADCNYDEDEFETALDDWKARKAEADRAVESEQEGARRANEAWQNDLQSYAQKKQAMVRAVPSYAEAEDLVISALNPMQQAVAVKAAQDPAALVVALSRSPAKLAELAKFDDPIKMAAAIARMEGTVKVVKRRKGPAPDRPLSGSGAMPGGSDRQLEKLEREADKSGDRTALIADKKKQAERRKT
jgi:hypothetical protein